MYSILVVKQIPVYPGQEGRWEGDERVIGCEEEIFQRIIRGTGPRHERDYIAGEVAQLAAFFYLKSWDAPVIE